MVAIETVLFILGLFLLVKGSDIFVASAVKIARQLGISEFLIGLTLVALGTSIPEIGTSITAALKHQSGLVLGNVLGSNITNINLITGIIATLWVLKTDRQMLERDGYIMLAASGLFLIFMLNGIVSRIEGFLLLLFYGGYVLFITETRTKRNQLYRFSDFVLYFFRFSYLRSPAKRLFEKKNTSKKNNLQKPLPKGKILKDVTIAVVSTIAIWYGSRLLVETAIFFAHLFSLPKTVIGLSIVALGTSLPELSVALSAARKGLGNIVVGNIIGSNIANILLIIGVTSTISPLAVSRGVILMPAFFMIAMTILFLIFIRSRWQLERYEAILFLFLYGVFLCYMFLVGGVTT